MERKYHFVSLVTGQIVVSIFDVVKVIIEDYLYSNIRNLHWEYSEEGF